MWELTPTGGSAHSFEVSTPAVDRVLSSFIRTITLPAISLSAVRPIIVPLPIILGAHTSGALENTVWSSCSPVTSEIESSLPSSTQMSCPDPVFDTNPNNSSISFLDESAGIVTVSPTTLAAPWLVSTLVTYDEPDAFGAVSLIPVFWPWTLYSCWKAS